MPVRRIGEEFGQEASSLAAGATGADLTLTGALAAASVAATGAVTAASVDASGEVECGSLDCLGAASVDGALDAASAAITGAITGASLDVSGEAECGTLDCLGAGTVAGLLTQTGGHAAPPRMVSSTPVTLAAGDLYTVSTNGSATTINLPASPVDGQVHHIVRKGAGAVTIGRNGKNIDGAGADDSLSNNHDGKSYVYSSANGSWYRFTGTGTF